ncbi:MAG: hypothetical protein HDR36_10450 [Treponema sp.]|nr:hypothetical protein [Treponema sp.]MBD5436895.1 hypothetical protein [Treponema sp.]MBD5440936.1 hypothetical protein [Treponema sp.]
MALKKNKGGKILARWNIFGKENQTKAKPKFLHFSENFTPFLKRFFNGK